MGDAHDSPINAPQTQAQLQLTHVLAFLDSMDFLLAKPARRKSSPRENELTGLPVAGVL
jgi:hypothetical protein